MRPNQATPSQPFRVKSKQDTPNTEELKRQLDTSSALNRTLGLIFMSVLIYMLITIASVTDMTLLLPDSRVTLPIINVEIGLYDFFIAGPLLVLGLHLNMLLNLYRHNAKVQHWLNYQKDKVHTKEELHPFIFNNLFFSGSKGYRTSAVLVGIGACYLPLMLILFFQLRFSDFQDFNITVFHFFLLILTYGIILHLYWPVNHLFYPTTRRVKGLFFYSSTLLIMIYSLSNVYILNQVVTSDYSKSWAHFMNYNYRPKEGILSIQDANYYRWLFNTIFYKPKLDVSETYISKEIDAAYVLHYINKEGLSEEEARKQAINKLGKTIYLKKRSLRYADFEKTDFSGVDLSQSDLSGAKLRYAKLQGIRLKNTIMHGAILQHAELQGSDLSNSELQGVAAEYARIDGVKMHNVNLQGANLLYVSMNGCDLSGAKMQCSSLDHTSMNGCRLSSVDMQGVNFRYTQMSGAILSGVQMQGATLTEVNTAGALFGTFHEVYSHTNTVYLYGAKGEISSIYWLNKNAIDTSTSYNINPVFHEVLPFLKNPHSHFYYNFQSAKKNLKSNIKVNITPNIKVFLTSRKHLLSNEFIPLSYLFFRVDQISVPYGSPQANPLWEESTSINDNLYQHLKTHVPQRLEEFRRDSANFIFSPPNSK